MVQPITYGNGIAEKAMNEAKKYLVATNPIQWDEWAKKLHNKPAKVVYCEDMEEKHLEQIAKDVKDSFNYVIGFGGGVACDTAKYLAWKLNAPLITIPTIISVDAFLCEAIGVRNEDRVRYVGAVKSDKILVDFDVIRRAPKNLNYGGVGDALSCASALGDWQIAHKQFGDPFNQSIFDETVQLVKKLITSGKLIHEMTDDAIKLMVDLLQWEVKLSEQWGNARPEEGGEHFLAYCLEKQRPARYLHGALIALNVLVVLKLQGPQAVFSVDEIKTFLDTMGLEYSPKKQGIERPAYERALNSIKEYVTSEKLFNGLWNQVNPFQYATIQEILDWIYSF